MSETAGPDLDDLLQRGYRYALSLVHDPGQAEDLVQEACVRISRQGGPWRLSYLITVIRNRYIDQYRRSRKIRFQPLEVDLTTEAEGAEADAGLGDVMQRALGRLRPEERELVFMAVVEGYSTSEVARITGRPRGTVLSAIHRAKQKLRRSLSEARDAS